MHRNETCLFCLRCKQSYRDRCPLKHDLVITLIVSDFKLVLQEILGKTGWKRNFPKY